MAPSVTSDVGAYSLDDQSKKGLGEPESANFSKDKPPYKKKNSKMCNNCEKGLHPPCKCFHLHPEP